MGPEYVCEITCVRARVRVRCACVGHCACVGGWVWEGGIEKLVVVSVGSGAHTGS